MTNRYTTLDIYIVVSVDVGERQLFFDPVLAMSEEKARDWVMDRRYYATWLETHTADYFSTWSTELVNLAPEQVEDGMREIHQAHAIEERVVLRRYPDGDVVALFPDQRFCAHSPLVTVFTREGHAGADYDLVIADTEQVDLDGDIPEEAQMLIDKLVQDPTYSSVDMYYMTHEEVKGEDESAAI